MPSRLGPYRINGDDDIEWYLRRRATPRRDGFLGHVLDWIKNHPGFDPTPPEGCPIDCEVYSDVMAYRLLRDEYPAMDLHLFTDEQSHRGWQIGLAARLGMLD